MINWHTIVYKGYMSNFIEGITMTRFYDYKCLESLREYTALNLNTSSKPIRFFFFYYLSSSLEFSFNDFKFMTQKQLKSKT